MNNQKKAKRNFLKPLIIGALAVVVTGGVGAYAYDKYETAQRAKIQDAYSNVKMNVGQQTNQNNNNNNNENNNNNGSNSNSQMITNLQMLKIIVITSTLNKMYKMQNHNKKFAL